MSYCGTSERRLARGWSELEALLSLGDLKNETNWERDFRIADDRPKKAPCEIYLASYCVNYSVTYTVNY